MVAHIGCVSFSESKNGALIQNLPDFAAERNAKSENGTVTLVTLCVRYGGLARNDVFLLFDELCDDTVENFLIGDSTSDNGVLALVAYKQKRF